MSAESLFSPAISQYLKIASTEPRAFERGEFLMLFFFMDLEKASTEPRAFERGEHSRYACHSGNRKASTEPRAFERGEAIRSLTAIA